MEFVRIMNMPACKMVSSGVGFFGDENFNRFEAFLNEYQDKKIKSCHGKIWMNMNLETFSDIRFLFDVLYQVLMQNKMIS